MSTSDKWAVLIGINYYLRRPGVNYPREINLLGCVEDVTQVETYLLTQSVKPSHITKLTSTFPTGATTAHPDPVGPSDRWPTHANIRKAFETLTSRVRAGDLVYIHYSGHGGRSATIYPDLKGRDGFDESLVPSDFRLIGGSLLRDVEMSYLVDNLVEKKVRLTIVLDSCHSASALRDPSTDSAVRGLENVDSLIPNSPRPDFPADKLAEAWERHTLSNVAVKENWLLEAVGYELLAACRPQELAREYYYDGKQVREGALTHWMLAALRGSGPNVTHSMLHRRVFDDVYRQSRLQAPVLSGRSERVFFGSAGADNPPTYTVPVTRPDLRNYWKVMLRAGAAHGVVVDAEYAVYAWDAPDVRDVGAAMAKVIITGVAELTANAQLVGTGIQVWPSGCQAVLLRSPKPKRVKLLPRTDLPASIPQTELLAKIRGLEWAKYGNGIVPLTLVIDSDDQPSAFRIAVNERSEYELRDSAGQPFPGLAGSSDPDITLTQAAHLARFQSVQSLTNLNGRSILKDRFSFSIIGLEPKNGVYEIAKDTTFTLTFRNNTDYAVNLTIYDLGPLYDIAQIYPSNTDYETIDANASFKLDLAMTIPDGRDAAIDVLKAFVTSKASSFRTLEMPPVAAGSDGGWARGAPSVLGEDPPGPTGMVLGGEDNDLGMDWGCAELRIRTLA